MSLDQSIEKQGNFLFKYRGQFPVFLFILSIPFIYSSSSVNNDYSNTYIISSVLFTLLGFLIRFYTIATTPKNTSGRNTNKQIAEILNTTGIYSIVRHPLYLANYLIWLGISLYTFNLYFLIFMSLFFWLFYKRIMFTEECFLKSKFGEKYLLWSKNVNSFIPIIFSYKKSEINFSFISILRREYSSVLSALIGYLFIDIIRNYFVSSTIYLSPKLLVIGSILLFIILILRSLKHYTNFLNEHDRS